MKLRPPDTDLVLSGGRLCETAVRRAGVIPALPHHARGRVDGLSPRAQD